MLENINRLSTVDIDSKEVLTLIQVFNSNRGHGHDGIPFRILKTCGQLKNRCLCHLVIVLVIGFFLEIEKKRVLSQHMKKENKQFYFYRFALKFLKN